MSAIADHDRLAEKAREFVLQQCRVQAAAPGGQARSDPIWRRMLEIGSRLWLDTGSIDESGQLWTSEFSALTTNNTLLNREIQKGTYDAVIPEAAKLLRDFDLTDQQRTLEIAFILNALHGLTLVRTYGAFVSVEEHTDLAGDVEAAVACGKRYHAVCPERFIVKVPFTPAGLLATRRLAADGVAVNHTLGFSARQNYVAARLAGPAYVNVFLGRLNSFVADNDLGDGAYVGERATLASQAAVRALRGGGCETLQIGASFRTAAQIRDLAGIDVLTMPPKVATEMLDLGIAPEQIVDRTGETYRPSLRKGVVSAAVGLDTLWDIGDAAVACMDALDNEDVDAMGADELVALFAAHGAGDLLVPWTDDEVAASAAEGKIPRLDNWRDALGSGRIGLDALMNLAGLNAFRADQKAMDDRVNDVLTNES